MSDLDRCPVCDCYPAGVIQCADCDCHRQQVPGEVDRWQAMVLRNQRVALLPRIQRAVRRLWA